MRTKILALLLSLLPSFALAQSAPANLPAQTVYGRLGVPGDTGPGQAIPFTSLPFTQVGIQPPNTVYSGPSSGGSAQPTFRSLVPADVPLSIGGLGGSQAAATANQVPLFPGSGGAAVPTTITPPLISYTAPGTGGQTLTQQVYDQRRIWAQDYGAKCDSVTDDTTAFQNAITQAQNSGIILTWLGACVTSSSLNVTSLLTVQGYGRGLSSLKPNVGVKAINVTTTLPIMLEDFDILYSTPNAGNIGISVSPASGENSISKFYRLFISQPSIGIEFDRASGWVADNVIVNQFSIFGIQVNNLNVADSGDSTITNSTLIGASGATAAVDYLSSGGLRVVNNKINGTALGAGVLLNLNAGASTGILIVSNNSIEGFSGGNGVGVQLQRQSTTGTFGKVIISDNEFNGPLKCVVAPTDATGAWLTELSITGNTCGTSASASAIAFDIDSVQGYTSGGNANTSNNAGTKYNNVGSSVTNCSLGVNVARGTYAADTGITRCVATLANGALLVTPTVFASLPTCNSALDGARAFITNNATALGVIGSAVTAGGAIHTPVYCDGSASAWKQG